VIFYLTVAVGVTQYTQKGHIARATLEATCFQTKAILDAMEKDSGHTLSELAVDGGMSNSDLAMQVRNYRRLLTLYLDIL
jgi:glycerol kinase